MLRFVLRSSIAVVTCLLLPNLASAKEPPDTNAVIEGGLASSCDADPDNIVRNCGFETGDFSSWVQSGDPSFTDVSTLVSHTGNFGGQLGPINGLGFLSQDLTTTAGGSYFIVFWLRNFGTPSEFGVYWDGNLLWRWPNTADFDYMRVAIGPVTASTSNTVLTFGFNNVPDYYYLDDIVVYAAGGGGTSCTQIMQPGMMGYLTSTGRCDLGMTLFADTTSCVNSDGTTGATFSGPINVRHAGVAGWLSWSSPPESESPTPWVGFAPGTTETTTFTTNASIAGMEVEPNLFQVFSMSASFRDTSGMEVARVTRDVDGSSGARLLAVSCSGPVIKQIVVTIDAAAQGFAQGQIRSDHITGAILGISDVDPQPVPLDATSNSQ